MEAIRFSLHSKSEKIEIEILHFHPNCVCLQLLFCFNVNILRVVSFIQLSFTENLQYLRLGDNDLHQIPSESLRPLHRLRHLDLRSNNISYISEDAFVGYGDSITFLNLQKNE